MTAATRDLLWAQMAPIHDAILRHPFIAGLTDGTLPRESFQHYVTQDSHYLRGYARALATCAAKAPYEAATVMFAGHARNAINAEHELHASLMAELGSSVEEAAAQPVAPTTQAYVSYLFFGTSGSFAEAVATVLPCYWIYAKVGEALNERSSPDPLYARWISTYGGAEFQETVDEVLAVTDQACAEAGPAELDRMRQHVTVASRYEWMFWDAGYRREQWPV